LKDVAQTEHNRVSTGIGEFDRVLGGGLVEGAVVLVGGDPGIGKSTLLLQAVAKMAAVLPVLYVTGEESLAQVAGRAHRLELPLEGVNALAETGVESILQHATKSGPRLIVADSVQTLWTETLTAAPGSVSQVRESAARLVRFAKETGTAVFLVGHVTKEGGIAGPRVL
ncbi:MAG: AAA family ATPase, partial [Massilia sp.]